MTETRELDRTLDTVAWGTIFIWWGISALNFLPNGLDAIGFGLILLGLNAVRSLNHIPTSNFSIILGILALLWGVLDLVNLLLPLPFRLPVLPILLITLGLILLAREYFRVHQTSSTGLR